MEHDDIVGTFYTHRNLLMSLSEKFDVRVSNVAVLAFCQMFFKAPAELFVLVSEYGCQHETDDVRKYPGRHEIYVEQIRQNAAGQHFVGRQLYVCRERRHVEIQEASSEHRRIQQESDVRAVEYPA